MSWLDEKGAQSSSCCADLKRSRLLVTYNVKGYSIFDSWDRATALSPSVVRVPFARNARKVEPRVVGIFSIPKLNLDSTSFALLQILHSFTFLCTYS